MTDAPQPSANDMFRNSDGDTVLILGRCVDTGKVFFYPRSHSPFTGGAVELISASGDGVIYSYSVLYRAKEPFCLAYITLAEGPTVLSNIVLGDGQSFEDIEIGAAVEMIGCEMQDGLEYPCFMMTQNKPVTV